MNYPGHVVDLDTFETKNQRFRRLHSEAKQKAKDARLEASRKSRLAAMFGILAELTLVDNNVDGDTTINGLAEMIEGN